jgi:AbrB family looped-hinge helix DNA binding protein
MTESTITAKGRTTVPAEVLALVHAKPGTRLVWSVTPDGTIIVRAKSWRKPSRAEVSSPAAHVNEGCGKNASV